MEDSLGVLCQPSETLPKTTNGARYDLGEASCLRVSDIHPHGPGLQEDGVCISLPGLLE